MFELFAVVLLLLLVGGIGLLIQRLRALSSEAEALRAELALIKQAQRDTAQTRAPAASPAPRPLADRPPAAPASAPAARMPPMRIAPTAPPGAAQPQLPLSAGPEGDPPPVPHDVLIRALQFPEDGDDTEGFRALRRALRDHGAGQLVRAAQDVLTLLSQEGLYMDDLTPDRARPEMWRRFAKGERGGAVAAIGGIRDRSALAVASGRLRQDPVFRDATHHFLRRFDKALADREGDLSDAQIVALSDTRSARAFMLLGRVMAIFD